MKSGAPSSPDSANGPPLRVAVAGATGFIGRALVQRLRATHEVIGLTRRAPPSEGDPPGRPGLRWRACDLFSLLDAERALEGAQVAVYLIHSMLPSARLTQARFADLDLIVADNFSRAAARMGLEQIVYLGGLLPEGVALSPHLASRWEVERTLAARGVPLTAVRAALVLGPGGSSFQILEKLVARLPVMLLPRWARSPTQPIALGDVLELLSACIGNPEVRGRVCEIGGPDVLTYRALIEETARAEGVRRLLVDVPVLSPRMSNLWVSLVTGAPLPLVAPLLESLRHAMVVKDRWLQARLGLPGEPVAKALASSLAPKPARRARPAARRPATPTGHVRSVQRLPLPKGWTADDVARAYTRWLPRFMAPFIQVDVDETRCCRFRVWPLRRPVLELTWSRERSTPDRQLFYITGGLLSRPVEGGRPRLEFREVLGGEAVLAALHDFTPRLPWLVYNLSQALVHLWVMSGFGRFLARSARAGEAPGRE